MVLNKIKEYLFKEKILNTTSDKFIGLIKEKYKEENDYYKELVYFLKSDNDKVKEKGYKILFWFETLNDNNKKKFLKENIEIYNNPHLIHLFFKKFNLANREILFNNFIINQYQDKKNKVNHYFEMNDEILKLIQEQIYNSNINGESYINFILDTLKNSKDILSNELYYNAIKIILDDSQNIKIDKIDLFIQMKKSGLDICSDLKKDNRCLESFLLSFFKGFSIKEFKEIEKLTNNNEYLKIFFESILLKEEFNKEIVENNLKIEEKNKRRL